MADVVRKVALDIGRNVYSGQLLRLPRRNGFTFSSEYHSHILRPPTVEEKFSQAEVRQKIRTAFDQTSLKKVPFEFAVIDKDGEFEMASKNFGQAYYDTLNNRSIFIPISPDDSPDMIETPPMENLVVVIPDFQQHVWGSVRWVMFGGIAFMVVILAAFFVTVKTLLDQKKLSEIKSDFINNMTHEFKTPLATISLAVDALRNEKVQADLAKTKYFSNIIKEENIRMNKHVETILQAALMEKQELQLNKQELHAHELLRAALDNYALQLEEKGAEIQLLLNARNDSILADEVHFSNVISNLIDNAIKYSREHLHITFSTHSTKNYFVLRIEDNGIGMSKESVKRIFEKFYRAHTGNLHNVKGFGLGMSYVKTVMDAHKGRIKVESTLGKGSVFTIEMPLAPGTEV